MKTDDKTDMQNLKELANKRVELYTKLMSATGIREAHLERQIQDLTDQINAIVSPEPRAF